MSPHLASNQRLLSRNSGDQQRDRARWPHRVCHRGRASTARAVPSGSPRPGLARRWQRRWMAI